MMISHQKLDTEGHIPVTYPQMVLLPWLSSMSRCSSCPICYLMASSGWDIYPFTKSTWSCRLSCPLHITWSLHPSSVDALVDVHRRSHSFPLIHPMEAFLAWCRVNTRPLSSCGIFLLSLSLGVGLTGEGLVYLSCAWWTSTHKGMPVSDAMRRSQLQWRTCDCVVLANHFIWEDVCWNLMHHLTRVFLLPVLNLPLSLKGVSLHQGQIARLQIHSSYFSVRVQFLSLGFCHWLGLSFLEGGPQLFVDSIHPHIWQRCLLWRPLHYCRWGSKSWLGTLAFVQTFGKAWFVIFSCQGSYTFCQWCC